MISIGISSIGYTTTMSGGGAVIVGRPYSVLKLKSGGLLLLKSGGYLTLKSIY